MRRSPFLLVVLAAVLADPAAVRAQEAPRNPALFQRTVPASTGALELRLAAGYDQGVGALGRGETPHVQDVAGVGGGAMLEVGYRISPKLVIGAFATGGVYSGAVPSASADSLAVGIQAGWHIRPYRALDPWVGLGVGVRWFWERPPGLPRDAVRGIELPRVTLGVDYRLNRQFAVGPAIAADLTFFTGAPSSFVGAGISVRFDWLGRPVHPALEVGQR